jgi:cation:H+ antiporter
MDASLIAILAGGLVLLLLGGDFLVRGASRMAQTLGMSPLLIGLTVVAFGTSAPELAASITAALEGQGDISFGNVVGSNILNVLLILGASAVITPLIVAQKLVRVDVPIMVGLSAAVLALGNDGTVSRLEGLLLFAGLIAYLLFSIHKARKEFPDVSGEYEEEHTSPGANRPSTLLSSIVLALAGLALLVLGSHWLVEGAISIARALGTSELIIGLTIVAAGTSLPEVATSILAAIKGKRDIAVGNVVGSCIFNILGVLGLTALVSPEGVPTTASAMRFDVPVMVAAAVACLPIFFTGYRINRWEGAVLFVYYVAYTAFLVLDASDHDTLSNFSWIMLTFVLPLTVLGFAVVTFREFRRRRGNHEEKALS